MKTTHLTAVTAQINAFSPHSKIPRLILSLLPANAHRTMQIKTTQLPRSSALPALLELKFKDGKTMKWQWIGMSGSGIKGGRADGEVGLQDVITEVDRHTRMLGRKEELSG